MKHEEFFTCDLGGETHKSRTALRNEASMLNGENHRIYGDVCDRHFAELARVIDANFKRNLHFKKEEKKKSQKKPVKLKK